MIIRTINSQGTISNRGSIIYSAPTGSTGYIDNIKFNNNKDENYTLSLYRYISNSRSKVLVYKYELSAGDMIDDGQPYQIKGGDHLYAIANSEVVFTINGTESITSR